MMELAVALAVGAILAAAAVSAVGRYGHQGKVRREAGRIVDGLWELRAMATTGVANPCMDFPDSLTVRLYRDTQAEPDGFDAADVVLRSYAFAGGVRTLSITGGKGPGHAVCFEGRGILGSSASALKVKLGAGPEAVRTVRLLPSTGIAKVL